MKRIPVIINISLCLFTFNTSPAQIDYKGFPQWSWHKQDSTEYYLYTPSASSDNGLYPIVLFLHGCCGESYHATLRNTVDPPVRMWHNFGANTQTKPTYIIAPATSRGWSQHILNLKKVMDDLVQYNHGDPRRIYITGFSMGGQGTWEFLQRYPDYFAAAIPMGMNFHGDHNKIKDIPAWSNNGGTDHWSNTIQNDIWKIRKLNGDDIDSNQNWVTGVNPKFTRFKGYGHGVQWIAASSQDLTGWAYSKINDGNKYPVIFFKSPAYNQQVNMGNVVSLSLQASDPDGLISKVVLYINGHYHSTLTKQPFITNITAPAGDCIIEATAFDNKGKTSTATTMVKSDIKTRLLTTELPYARQGAFYVKQLFADGNGTVRFSLAANTLLPAGLILNEKGVVSGIPQTKGTHILYIKAKDEDGDADSIQYNLSVAEKKPEEIVLTNIMNDSGVSFPVSEMRVGAVTSFDNGDNEVTVSYTCGFDGITYIAGNNKDTGRSGSSYLSFDADEDATVYIAYERKDNLFTSTIPEWLKGWQKEPSCQVAEQYFYYNVYFKDFPRGKIILPGADKERNNVGNNYFVMVRKSQTPFQFAPEINTSKLSRAYLHKHYKEQVTALHGRGSLSWQITKGALPKGVQLLPGGILTGIPETKGSFSFRIEVKDENANTSSRQFEMSVH